MPTGATAMESTVPAAAFPALPASRARAGTSTWSCPAGRTAARVVSNRTKPAVIHTVPKGISLGVSAAWSAKKRRVPAVWGNACRATQSAWRYSA